MTPDPTPQGKIRGICGWENSLRQTPLARTIFQAGASTWQPLRSLCEDPCIMVCNSGVCQPLGEPVANVEVYSAGHAVLVHPVM